MPARNKDSKNPSCCIVGLLGYQRSSVVNYIGQAENPSWRSRVRIPITSKWKSIYWKITIFDAIFEGFLPGCPQTVASVAQIFTVIVAWLLQWWLHNWSRKSRLHNDRRRRWDVLNTHLESIRDKEQQSHGTNLWPWSLLQDRLNKWQLFYGSIVSDGQVWYAKIKDNPMWLVVIVGRVQRV